MLAAGYASIAICQRCEQKRPYMALVEDGNIKGLRVCGDRDCRDPISPWRLPPCMPDALALRFPRPDTPIGLNAPPATLEWDTPGLEWDEDGLTWDYEI